MKIGYDAKRFFNNFTGLGNYSRYVINNFSKFYKENQIYLFTPKIIQNFINQDYKVVLPTKKSLFWRFFNIVNEKDFKSLDVYHGLSNELPYFINKTKVKSVLTVHDLIFILFPQYYNFIDRKIYKIKINRSLKIADKIIAISLKTKCDIINIFGIDSKKIDVVYQSCSDVFKILYNDKDIQNAKYELRLPSEYILYVGTIEERKNLLTLIKSIKNIDFPLVVVGKKTNYFKDVSEFVNQNNLNNKIYFIHEIESSQLAKIYQGAKIFVNPSVYEGFGIPIIEAFYSRVPCILSNIDIFREVADDAAIYFNKNNHLELQDIVKKLLTDNDLQKDLVRRASKRLTLFDDENIATQLFNIYKSIL